MMEWNGNGNAHGTKRARKKLGAGPMFFVFTSVGLEWNEGAAWGMRVHREY